MKLLFILHGFQKGFLYKSACPYPVCWLPEKDSLYRYSRHHIAFVEESYTQQDIERFNPYWRNYTLKKLI